MRMDDADDAEEGKSRGENRDSNIPSTGDDWSLFLSISSHDHRTLSSLSSFTCIPS